MKIASQVSKLTLVAMLASLATAQNDPPTKPDPRQPSDRAGDTQGRGTSTEADRVLASWLQVSNNTEIELAKVAQQRSQNPQVKEFAQTMIKEHGEFGQKLTQFGDAGALGPGGTRTDPSGRDPTGRDPSGKDPSGKDPAGKDPSGKPTDPTGRQGDPPARPIDSSGSRTGGEFNHGALVKELGQQCLSSAKRELESKSGAEFDRCYVGMQIGAHMQMLDTLQVFQRHASERLRSTLQQGEQTVQMHLQHAKQLGKQLEGAGDGKE